MSVRPSSDRPPRSRGELSSAGALPPASASRLRDRRRQRRRRLLVLAGVLVLALAGVVVYGLWQPGVRISSVQVYGGDAALAAYATSAMEGSYLGIIPRDSTFFIPKHRMRTALLAARPDIAALSIFRHGTTGLSIRISMRTAVGRWCGLAPSPSGVEGLTPYCYLFDPGGFIYAAVPEADASSTPPAPGTLNSFVLYSSLVNEVSEPLGATLARAAELPEAFNFARQLSDFNATATTVIVHEDEADILLTSGTRITYVLGHEQDSYTALDSAHTSFNLADGSAEYLDLRFPGKVYVKKKGE